MSCRPAATRKKIAAENSRDYREKFAAYHEYRSSGRFQLDYDGFPTILVITADKATKPSGSRQFYERAGSTDKMLKLYEGHYHDLLADIGKQRYEATAQDSRLLLDEAWRFVKGGTLVPA